VPGIVARIVRIPGKQPAKPFRIDELVVV